MEAKTRATSSGEEDDGEEESGSNPYEGNNTSFADVPLSPEASFFATLGGSTDGGSAVVSDAGGDFGGGGGSASNGDALVQALRKQSARDAEELDHLRQR